MIQVLKSGLYTTIQDLGRFGYRGYGVPVSGAMDQYHFQLANQLLNNETHAAVLEVTLQGPKLLFKADTQIVITGADLSPMLNESPIQNNAIISIRKGDVLNFGKRQYGTRAYIAIKDGFQTPKVMNSRSFYNNVTECSILKTNDSLAYNALESPKTPSYINLKPHKALFTSSALNVFKGPEYDLLTKDQQSQIDNNVFSIGINNRMAYQLSETIPNDLPSIITSAVLPGTVQLTPSGKLIILMADCQTTGGYPRVLQLSQKSINLLSQKLTGDTIKFKVLESE